MQTKTIQKLNQLNQQFYLSVADDFDQSRNIFWNGWEKLLPHIPSTTSNSLSVLDIGCGNGRFGQFLAQQLPDLTIKYTGLDNSTVLLKYAETKLQPAKIQAQFIELDLIEHLLSRESLLEKQTYDLLIAFGLFHHIASFDFRSKLFQQLSVLVAPKGILCVSFWQFLNSVKLRQRIVEPASIDINSTDWEKNDFILDWRAGDTPAYRYCHYINNQEEIALLKQTNLKVIDEYFADGATKNLNHYLVMKK